MGGKGWAPLGVISRIGVSNSLPLTRQYPPGDHIWHLASRAAPTLSRRISSR